MWGKSRRDTAANQAACRYWFFDPEDGATWSPLGGARPGYYARKESHPAMRDHHLSVIVEGLDPRRARVGALLRRTGDWLGYAYGDLEDVYEHVLASAVRRVESDRLEQTAPDARPDDPRVVARDTRHPNQVVRLSGESRTGDAVEGAGGCPDESVSGGNSGYQAQVLDWLLACGNRVPFAPRRCALGAKVSVLVGDEWKDGVVSSHRAGEGKAAYAVKLDESGRTVAIRKDDEELIKPHAEDAAARAGTTVGRVVAVG